MCAAVFLIVTEYRCQTVTVSSLIVLSFMFQAHVTGSVSVSASP